MFKEHIALIIGNMPYERSDILTSCENISNILKKNDISFNIIDLNNVDIIKKTPFKEYKTIFIIDPFYLEEGNKKDIRVFFEKSNINYIGASLKTTNICKNKVKTKLFIKDIKKLFFPMTLDIINNSRVLSTQNSVSYPIIAKPTSDACSAGVSLLYSHLELNEYLAKNINIYKEIMLEEYIDGIDITVPVMKINNKITVLPAIELELIDSPIYDSITKFNQNSVNRYVPARLPAYILDLLNILSKKIYLKINPNYPIRIDYRIDKSFNIYFIEVNSNPAIARDEHVARSAKEIGISYEKLMLYLLNPERKKHEF